jgi:hypothetical protein
MIVMVGPGKGSIVLYHKKLETYNKYVHGGLHNG